MGQLQSYETIQDFWRALLPADRADQPCLYTRYREQFRPYSYKDLHAQAHCTASYLMDKGVLKGQMVALLSPPHQPAIVFDLALQFIGAIGVHLPLDLPTKDIQRLHAEFKFQFLFIGDHALYQQHQEFVQLKPTLKGIVLETEDAEGLAPEKLVTHDIVVLRGKIAWREQMELLNEMKQAVTQADIYAMFPSSPDAPTDLTPIKYAQVLQDLDQALQHIQEQEEASILSTTPEDRYLHHIHGTFAPIASVRPLYLLSPDALSPEITTSVKPGQVVGTPDGIEKMYHLLPQTFLQKTEAADLETAQELIDIREEAAQAGKKPPFMKNMKYRRHNLRLYKQVRKKWGGQLSHIVCDQKEPEARISRFIRECGIEIQVMS